MSRQQHRCRQRGSLIVSALMLFSILLVLGLGLMSSQSARMKAARAQVEGIQAKQLCLAGWQDVRVKLGVDALFPPPGAHGSFGYSEDVFDSSGELLGTYTVIIDLEYRALQPDFDDPGIASEGNLDRGLYRITCIGKVGGRGFEPVAERTMTFEVDMTTFKVIRVEDHGGL